MVGKVGVGRIFVFFVGIFGGIIVGGGRLRRLDGLGWIELDWWTEMYTAL